jgi:ubiquinone biosynthesis protein COQ9
VRISHFSQMHFQRLETRVQLLVLNRIQEYLDEVEALSNSVSQLASPSLVSSSRAVTRGHEMLIPMFPPSTSASTR